MRAAEDQDVTGDTTNGSSRVVVEQAYDLKVIPPNTAAASLQRTASAAYAAGSPTGSGAPKNRFAKKKRFSLLKKNKKAVPAATSPVSMRLSLSRVRARAKIPKA